MKFINSSYENGISTVIMEHKGEYFTGIAKLHPDDIDKASEFAGGDLAESRAVIKALKYERKLLLQEAETCRKFVRACKQQKNWDNDSSTAKSIYHQLNIKIKKVNEITDEINKMLSSNEKTIMRRDIVLNAIERNRAKKDNL